MKEAIIPGGATLWSRQTTDSEIFSNKPHEWFKIWFYLVNRVSFKTEGKYTRGELFLKYEWICDATRTTKNQVDGLIRWAKKNDMLTTRKTTRGMILKITNYSKYQTLDNYYYEVKTDTETEMETKQKRNRNDTIQKNVKNDKNIPKGIQKTVTYGNPLINEIIEIVKTFNNISTLDGTIKENRQYANLLIKGKLKPTFKQRTGNDINDNEILLSLKAILNNADNFHKKNLTNIKYIYYNFGKLIKNNAPVVADLDNI